VLDPAPIEVVGTGNPEHDPDAEFHVLRAAAEIRSPSRQVSYPATIGRSDWLW
jgi:hypothetical protein